MLSFRSRSDAYSEALTEAPCNVSCKIRVQMKDISRDVRAKARQEKSNARSSEARNDVDSGHWAGGLRECGLKAESREAKAVDSESFRGLHMALKDPKKTIVVRKPREGCRQNLQCTAVSREC